MYDFDDNIKNLSNENCNNLISYKKNVINICNYMMYDFDKNVNSLDNRDRNI